ncbi:MAG: hypothetical protein SX243_15590 [Acidobacteriota bacterium]|nr:hypothetical protein [Acidobacteriota bacterium]
MYLIQARKFDRWMVPAVILLAAVVGSAGIVLPGPQWAYLVAAGGILLLGVLFVRGMAHATLEFFGYLSPAVGWVLARRQRRAEFALLVRGLQSTLEHYGLHGLREEELKDLAEEPASSAQEDVTHACRAFARGLDGEENERPRAQVYELLYRDRYDLGTAGCWTDSGQATRRELARVLVASGRLSDVASEKLLERVLPWIFPRLWEFRLQTVQDEVAAVEALWQRAEIYAEHLRAEGLEEKQLGRHRGEPLEQILEELDQVLEGGLIGRGSRDEVTEFVLLSVVKQWIGAWSASRSESDGIAPADLARVHLGIFAAEQAPTGFPALPGLAVEVAQRPPALGMLFGYLWKRSKLREPTVEGPGLAILSERWKGWVEKAEEEMGSGLSHAVRGVLRSQLNNRSWPTWLPILPAIDRIVRQSERIHEELQALSRHQSGEPEWSDRLEHLGSRIEEMTALAPSQEVGSQVQALQRRILELQDQPAPGENLPLLEQLLAELRASLLPGHLRSVKNWDGAREAWDRLAQEHRPGLLFRVLDECRRDAAELVERLAELEERLQAEATGGSAYVITFDQRYGPVAELIDSLADQYGFRHYTRYSRLGELRPGESFEELYARLSADLERVFQPILRKAVEEARRGDSAVPAVEEAEGSEEAAQPHDSWEDIEITVQQISLLHRHDFAVDQADRLASVIQGLQAGPHPEAQRQPPPEQVLRKVFKLPPSSTLLGVAPDQRRAV